MAPRRGAGLARGRFPDLVQSAMSGNGEARHATAGPAGGPLPLVARGIDQLTSRETWWTPMLQRKSAQIDSGLPARQRQAHAPAARSPDRVLSIAARDRGGPGSLAVSPA